MTIATILTSISSAIILILGVVHLVYTFVGSKLFPADPSVAEAMKIVPLVITNETTVWNAWIGFNATHSIALILFGLIYGYLSLFQPFVLFGSLFLQALGMITLVALVVLSWNYFFSVPLAGVSISLLLYAAGLIASRYGY